MSGRLHFLLQRGMAGTGVPGGSARALPVGRGCGQGVQAGCPGTGTELWVMALRELLSMARLWGSRCRALPARRNRERIYPGCRQKRDCGRLGERGETPRGVLGESGDGVPTGVPARGGHAWPNPGDSPLRVATASHGAK